MDYQNDDRGYAEDRNGDRYDNQDAGRDRDRERSRSPRRDHDGDVRIRDSSPRRNGDAPRDAPPPEEEEGDVMNTGTNLFVTGIHPRLREEEIQEKFEKFGPVVSCNIMRDPHTRESRGFGFIQMETVEAADAAKEALQGENYEGRTLSIEKARRGKPRGPTPGKYYGPPKREDFRGGRRDDRRGGYRDDYRRGPPGGYGRPYDSYGRDDRYGGGRDRDRGYYGGGGGGYGRDDRYGGGRDRERDRGYGGGYDSRPPRDDYDSRAARGPAGEDRYR